MKSESGFSFAIASQPLKYFWRLFFSYSLSLSLSLLLDIFEYNCSLQVLVVTERRGSGWTRPGALKGGTVDSDANPKESENVIENVDLALPPGGHFSAAHDEISINSEGESSAADTDDNYTGLGDGYESALEYGEEAENLIDGLYDEL